jgi:hypothetical protein
MPKMKTGLKVFIIFSLFALTFTACSKKSKVTDVTDTTAPVISTVASGTVSGSGAAITWTTDEASTSQVEYGTTISYGSTTTEVTTLTTSHSVNLTGLVSSTVYHYRVKSKDANNNLAVGDDKTLTTTADTTGPVISSVSVPSGTIKNNSVVITWTTDEAATTKVEYGTTASYGGSSEKDTTTLVTSHSVTITGLTKNTAYHYRVSGKDASNNSTVDADRAFTTANITPLVIYDFEATNVQGWREANDATNFPAINLGTPVISATEFHGGAKSLAFPFDMTKRDTRYDAPLYIVNDAGYVAPPSVTDLSSYGTLTIYMFIPAAPAPTKPIAASVYIKTGSTYYWYESSALQALTPGTWATITLDFGNAKHDDANTGLTIQNLNDVKEMGIHIGDGRGDATTTLYIDDVTAE